MIKFLINLFLPFRNNKSKLKQMLNPGYLHELLLCMINNYENKNCSSVHSKSLFLLEFSIILPMLKCLSTNADDEI